MPIGQAKRKFGYRCTQDLVLELLQPDEALEEFEAALIKNMNG